MPDQSFSQQNIDFEREKVIKQYFQLAKNDDFKSLDKLVVSESTTEEIGIAGSIRHIYIKEIPALIKKRLSRIKRIDWYLDDGKEFYRVFYEGKDNYYRSGGIFYQDLYFVLNENQEWLIYQVKVLKTLVVPRIERILLKNRKFLPITSFNSSKFGLPPN
jgi:hypothetical protein